MRNTKPPSCSFAPVQHNVSIVGEELRLSARSVPRRSDVDRRNAEIVTICQRIGATVPGRTTNRRQSRPCQSHPMTTRALRAASGSTNEPPARRWRTGPSCLHRPHNCRASPIPLPRVGTISAPAKTSTCSPPDEIARCDCVRSAAHDAIQLVRSPKKPRSWNSTGFDGGGWASFRPI